MVRLGLDTIDLRVASVAEAIRDRTTRGQRAMRPSAGKRGWHATTRQSAIRRYDGQTRAAQVVQRLRPHGQHVIRNPGFFASVRGQSALPLDLVNYFRDFSVTQVKYGLVANRVNQLSDRWTTVPIDQRTAFCITA